MIDPTTMPPRPWRVVPAIPGSPAFIRSADDKNVVNSVRSDGVAAFICQAVNAFDAANAIKDWKSVTEQQVEALVAATKGEA